MSRVPPIRPEDLTPEQKRLHDEIARTRARAFDGPFGVWMHNPAIADPGDRMQNAFRLHGKLDRRLAELVILLVAREWTAQYAWYLHAKLGLNAGLAKSTVDAVRERRKPPGLPPDEELIYDLVTELQAKKTLSAATYDRALAALGLEVLIEAVSAAGFYTMVCMTLNAFDVPLPAGVEPIA